MRLFEVLSRWFGRVEIALALADDTLREAEAALARGDALRAEAAAKQVLERVPGSVLALALLADAREAAGLYDDLLATLDELVTRVPSRAEVWTRLGAARRRLARPSADVREAYLRALGVAAPGSEARRDALLALCDLDLAEGDVGRAELWLAGIAPNAAHAVDVALRQAELALARNDATRALAELERVVAADATDGRFALARARAFALAGRADVFAPATRAYLLDMPGASELLSSSLGWIATDAPTRERLRALVDAHGELGHARWRAAFARAEGRRDEARAALGDALAGGDQSAAMPLLEAALDDRDIGALGAAVRAAPASPLLADADVLVRGAAAKDAPEAEWPAMLAALASVEGARSEAFAGEILTQFLEHLVPPTGLSQWSFVLSRLDAHARSLHDLDATSRVAELAALRARPVRLAIVGEFNAGKSTFVNALMGQDAAPTGVLPTTATQHLLRYGPDEIARIRLHEATPGPSGEPLTTRTVPLSELRRTLAALGDANVDGVEIELPLASLTRVEIIDTPGFNAPNRKHTDAARRALEEADVLLWLLDASQPLKQTERVVLEEAKAARIPLQILVGKADRIAPEDHAKVLAMVEEALRETGLPSLSPPRLFSARVALAEKLGQAGDSASPVRSGWAEVERILDEEVVARSDAHKERALRRRAHALVERLLGAARATWDRERTDETARSERARALATAAAEIDRDADAIAAALVRSLTPADKALEGDLAVSQVAPSADADGALFRYRMDRAMARLTPTLAAALSGVAQGTGLAPADLTALARLLVRTVSASLKPPFTEALARAALPALTEHLRALALATPTRSGAAALARELGAFAHVMR
ncbi:MAG: dynamin family protein [Myxococcales bacterium]|nr:dynamin family protein [Myxococcales bacterium]